MYILQKKDIKRASVCLVSAFENYPIFVYILPNNEERKIKLEYIFIFLLSLGISNGEVIADSEKLAGISIWYSLKSMNVTLCDVFRSGLISLYLKLDGKSFRRFMDLKRQKSIVRNQLLNDKQLIFLDVMGIDPLYQKKGIASSLLLCKLKEFDQLQLDCYLETSDRKNIKYYEKFGFSVIKEYKIYEFEVFCMIREFKSI